MSEIMCNINKEISVKVAEIYIHTHLNSAKQNINEIKTPKR